jgi:hypothetical protein
MVDGRDRKAAAWLNSGACAADDGVKVGVVEGFPRIAFLLLLVAWLGPIIALFFRNAPVRTSLLFALVYFVALWGGGFLAALSGNSLVVILVLAAVITAAWVKAFRV